MGDEIKPICLQLVPYSLSCYRFDYLPFLVQGDETGGLVWLGPSEKEKNAIIIN